LLLATLSTIVDMRLAGYPDVSSGATIVQMVKKQLVVTRPPLVAEGSTWDAHVTMWPNSCFRGVGVKGGPVTGTNLIADFVPIENFNYGGCTARTGPAGFLDQPSDTAAPTSKAVSAVTPQDFCRGNYRVIGMGFEVVNTTAEIYKQGSVTVYRQPNTVADDIYFDNRVTSNPTPSTVSYVRLPPTSVADANLLLGTRSWAASEGAYVVSRQNSVVNPMCPSAQRMIVLANTDRPSGYAYDSEPATALTFFPATFPINAYIDKILPFDISGAIFTGLSSQTSLTINVRWIIERLPTPSEGDLAVLATPSALYDSLALEIFSQAMNQAPPGVMVKENPLGEWFNSVLKSVSSWAPKIGDALGSIIPGAGLVGKGLGAVAGKLYREPKPTEVAILPTVGSASDLRRKPKIKPKPKVVYLKNAPRSRGKPK